MTTTKISEIWYTFCPVAVVSHIAQDRGWLTEEFTKDNIKISHISCLSVENWQSHFSHQHPLLFRDGGNIPPIWAKAEGFASKVIGMTWSEDRQVIMVSKDSPIQSVNELKGKKVALPRRLPNLIDWRRTLIKRGIVMSLLAHKLSEDDIQFVDQPIDIPDIAKEKTPGKTGPVSMRPKIWQGEPTPEVDALKKGEVDAIYTFNGRDLALEKEGIARAIYNLHEHPDWQSRISQGYPYICTVSADFANEHPDLIIKWMKVLIKAGVWAKSNRTDVVQVMARAMKLSEDTFQKAFPADFHQHLVPEISHKGIDALEIQKKFLKEHGFINNEFDVRNWVDGSYLEAAMKELREK